MEFTLSGYRGLQASKRVQHTGWFTQYPPGGRRLGFMIPRCVA